jgi:hypothetical protein
MVCLQQESIRAVDIADAVGLTKVVDPSGELVCAAEPSEFVLETDPIIDC